MPVSLAGKVLDLHDDPGASLLKEAADQGLTPPLYVLSHRLDSEAQALPDEFFAYVHRSPSGGTVRKYACDSKATTWINGLYFLKLGGVFPPKVQQQIAAKLAEFHALHGVPQPDLLTKVAAATEVVPVSYELPSEPVTENQFALTETSSQPRYPIANWDHIKRACDYFEDNWRVMPIPQRREFAVKVASRVRELARETIQGRHEVSTSLAKVASLDLKRGYDPVHRLPQMLELYASETPCETRIANAIGERIKTLEKRGHQELADTYRELHENRGSYTVDKFAEALVRMDDASGLEGLYGRRLLDPYLSILKIAEDPIDDVVHAEDGITLTRGDLQRLVAMKDELYRMFDPAMVEELIQDPEAVFPSLPRPEKQALAALLQQ